MNRYASLLKKLGLSEKESAIYLDLLEHGESSITDVVDRTRVHRPDAYKFIPLLVERGFVTETLRGKRRFFSAESPEAIRSLLENLENDVDALLPDLVGMHSRAERRPSVKFMEGRKAVTYVFSDIVSTLKAGDTFYRVSSERDVDRANSYLPPDYRTRRDKKELERYVIMSAGQSEKKAPRLEREIVTIPPELDEFSDDVSMIVYGNKVAFIDYNTEASIVIENAFIAGFLGKLFRLLYASMKRAAK
ncbi:MAG: helix-turn-helix domain-containing protein [Patescibacteria group bacterium]